MEREKRITWIIRALAIVGLLILASSTFRLWRYVVPEITGMAKVNAENSLFFLLISLGLVITGVILTDRLPTTSGTLMLSSAGLAYLCSYSIPGGYYSVVALSISVAAFFSLWKGISKLWTFKEGKFIKPDKRKTITGAAASVVIYLILPGLWACRAIIIPGEFYGNCMSILFVFFKCILVPFLIGYSLYCVAEYVTWKFRS